MFSRGLNIWLPTYALTSPARAYHRHRRRHQLTHIIFLVCDHFEPRHGVISDDQPFERLRTWRTEYARFQERCRARFGSSPMHTWFYPPHHGTEHLANLSAMVFDGLGEVELHYHHRDDTVSTLRSGLKAALAEYHRWGHLLESGEFPHPTFGFIHGDWALNNACGGKFCGVNDELTLLQEMGCWGDLTMPSDNECQTRKINSIYYAVGDPHRAKAHDWGIDARVGRMDSPGLFLMQGPLGINWRAPDHPRIENASLTSLNWGRPDRIRKWLDCNVHVKGRPEWLFVKLHAHGAIEKDFDALFGEKAFEMHRVLNEQYNDGQCYRLHYVTARQAYNIAKAAEHGKRGNPSDWVDYLIQPPANRFYTADARHDVKYCTKSRLSLANIESGAEAQVRTRVGPIRQVRGRLTAVDVDDAAGCARIATAAAGTEVTIQVDTAFHLHHIDGGSVLKTPDPSESGALRLSVGPQCTIKFRHD